MFCTIKFVYYKSFCVRDDIGSYIRTVYHMVSHTPKRGVGGSNPLWDASQQRRKPLFSRVFGVSYMKKLFHCTYRKGYRLGKKTWCLGQPSGCLYIVSAFKKWKFFNFWKRHLFLLDRRRRQLYNEHRSISVDRRLLYRPGGFPFVGRIVVRRSLWQKHVGQVQAATR